MLVLLMFGFPVVLLLGALALERLERSITESRGNDRAQTMPRRIRVVTASPSSR
jgi:hypothetical protein